jgi:Pentapeptide repeats (8 copies)
MSFRKRLSRLFDFLLNVRIIGAIFVITALLIGGLGYIQLHGTFNMAAFLSDFYANLTAEFASIGITVLIIDSLNRRRERKRDKKEEFDRLISDLRSGVKDSRDHALHELKERGWFRDGTLTNKVLGRIDLSNMELQDSKLIGANLMGANLSGANLFCTDLSGVNLFCADLSNANLADVNLGGAILVGTNLSGANLDYANLSYVNLEGAKLTGANLWDANLWGARFNENTLLPNQTHWTLEQHEAKWWERFLAVMIEPKKGNLEWEEWKKHSFNA